MSGKFLGTWVRVDAHGLIRAGHVVTEGEVGSSHEDARSFVDIGRGEVLFIPAPYRVRMGEMPPNVEQLSFEGEAS